MNKEFLKMQKLAGLITEGQYKKKLNEGEPEFTYNDPELGDPDSPEGFKWKEQPANPNAMLTMDEDSDESEGDPDDYYGYNEPYDHSIEADSQVLDLIEYYQIILYK